MQQTTFTAQKTTLDSLMPKQIDPNAVYLVDWNKIERPEQLIMILAAIGISFSGSHPMIQAIAGFLDTNNPIYPNGNPAEKPVPADLKLPKLKKVK